MKRFFFISFLFFALASCTAQVPANAPSCEDPSFDAKVKSLLSFTVPLLGVDDLENATETFNILDAREKDEFNTGHIQGATFVGYDRFDMESVKHLDKDKPVVVYCSIGYRSEKIGEKLQKAGFTKVYNLHGSLFEWVNQGNPLVDAQGKPTQNIHTYNKNWSQWVLNERYKKVW